MGKKSRVKIKTDRETKLSSILNDLTFNDYFNRLKKIATSVFKWENLPNSCDEDFLENSLFENGKASFLQNNEIIINTDCTSNGYINLYNIPTKFNCFSANGENYYRDLYIDNSQNKEKACILVKNTKDMQATATTLELFAYRLYVAERTIDINVHNLRIPYFISCDEKMLTTIQTILNKIENFQPHIIGRKNTIDNIDTQVFKTDTQFLANDLEIYKDKIWNEALTFLRN